MAMKPVYHAFQPSLFGTSEECPCKTCKQKRANRKYRLAHPEKQKQWLRKYYYANQEERRRHMREYAQARSEQRHAADAIWRKANGPFLNEYHRRRYAEKKAVTVGEVDYDRILARDGMYCYICEQSILPDHKIDFDHVIPLSRGGAHTEDNIKVTHRPCNRRKFNRLLEEMTPHQRRGV